MEAREVIHLCRNAGFDDLLVHGVEGEILLLTKEKPRVVQWDLMGFEEAAFHNDQSIAQMQGLYEIC